MEIELFGVGAVASITVVAYLAGLIVKATPLDNDRYIPLVCGFVGGLFGLLSYFYHLDNFVVGDPVTALAIGIVSGLSATGIDQVSKQLNGYNQNSEDTSQTKQGQ